MNTTWMVRAGEGGYLIDEFRKKNRVAIGWSELGNLSTFRNKEELRKAMQKAYADWSEGKISASISTVWRFLRDIKNGDGVISYDPGTRTYSVGQIAGEYRHDLEDEEGYANARPVTWTGTVSRDDLSVGAKNSLGAIQALFIVPGEVTDEFSRLLKGEKPQLAEKDEDAELENLKQDTQERAREFIKDRIHALSWDQMQDLVAGLLRGMGYKPTVSRRGSDRGKDIVASPDGLGLEQPRIRAEVKHQARKSMGAPEIRSFIGALRSSDKGLYISTGGFSNEAHYEAERSNVPLTLVDLDGLVYLLEQHYDNLDVETRSLVPLVKVYWPADLRTA